MSDNKKYYYLRLKENFFESDEIVLLESMPDGHIYSNILLKLYLKSLKQEGKLMFNNRIPFSPNMLATITRHPVGVVEKAITIFSDLELIEILDNGAIYMLDIQNFIGKTSTEAERKKAYRAQIKAEKQSLLEGGQMSGHLSDVRPPELEIEKDIETEKEQLLQQEKKSSGVWLSFSTYQKLWLFPNHIQKEHLVELINTYSDELVNAAIILAGKNDVPKNRSLNFVEACLREWNNANVKTVDEARVYTVNRSKMHKQAHQKKSYGNVRKEQLPEWASNPEQIPQVEEDPAVKAELERRLAEYQRKKAENDGA